MSALQFLTFSGFQIESVSLSFMFFFDNINNHVENYLIVIVAILNPKSRLEGTEGCKLNTA